MGKHIVLVVENLSVPFDRRVWREAMALNKAGYKVSVISPMGLHTDNLSYEEIAGIEVYRYRLPLSQNSQAGYIFEYLTAFFATLFILLKISFRCRVEAIHVANPPDIFFPLGWIGKIFRWKFIFDQHDLAPETYLYKFGGDSESLVFRMLKLMEKWTFRTADHVIATNESIKQVAMKRGMKQEGDITIVRNGPDQSFLPIAPDDGLRRGRKYLAAYIGVMGKQDGVEYILHAADYLIHQKGLTSIHFILIGYGDEYENLIKLSEDLDLGEYIELPGRLPDSEVLAILSTADVCLAPDPKNGLNEFQTMNKIMDYMRCAKPIVSFNLDETRYTAGDAAVYIEKNSAEQFGDAIINLLRDPTKREKMGAAGRKKVDSVLAWEYSVSYLLKVYKGLFGKDK